MESLVDLQYQSQLRNKSLASGQNYFWTKNQNFHIDYILYCIITALYVNCITYSTLFNDTNIRQLRRPCNFLKIVIDIGHILVQYLYKSSYTCFMHTTVLQLPYFKGQGYMHWIFEYSVITKDKCSVRLCLPLSDNSDLCNPKRYGQCSNWKFIKIDCLSIRARLRIYLVRS